MIKLRAHHLLCIPRFYGRGYNGQYEKSFEEICRTIRENPEVKVQIVRGTDQICSRCPYEQGDACNKRAGINHWILFQDQKVLYKLGISVGDFFAAKDIFRLSIEKISPKDIEGICKGCEFLRDCLESGVNSSFIEDLNNY
ncbi:MAG: DUF1284 domain-containing protein [Nanoarchaeota archaeon]